MAEQQLRGWAVGNFGQPLPVTDEDFAEKQVQSARNAIIYRVHVVAVDGLIA